MYMTRMWINRARRGTRKLLSSPQAMHAAVMAGFVDPAETARNGARPLWRVDELPDARIALYVVSAVAPDLTHLIEQAGWPTTQKWETKAYDGLLADLEAGQSWAFRLTANPVQSRPPRSESAQQGKQQGKRTQRYGHVTVAQQQEWLLERAERNGFRVPEGPFGEPDVIVHGRSTQTFQRGERRVTLRVASFDGRLEVTDPDALRRTMIAGLGHAKAYGCGLLTLAPVA